MSLAVVSANQSYDVFDLQFNRSVLRAARHMYRSSYLPHLEPEGLVQAQELHLQRPRHKWEPWTAQLALARLYLYHHSVLLLPVRDKIAKSIKKKSLERGS